jgi:hypothetical protein
LILFLLVLLAIGESGGPNGVSIADAARRGHKERFTGDSSLAVRKGVLPKPFGSLANARYLRLTWLL